MVPILKMRRFSCLLRLSLPQEMGEMAQTFISEIEWLAVLNCRATGLFFTKRKALTLDSDMSTSACAVHTKRAGKLLCI